MSENLHTIPARILTGTVPSEQLREMLADLGDGIEPFFWSAEISNNRLDSYYSRMAESTLRNFADDAREGRSFLDSHNNRNLGYGQSVNGVFEATGETARTVADFYTVPGIRFGGNGPTYASTDDFIRAVNARLARDVSVGFHDGDDICDVCGHDVYRWYPGEGYRCPHLPGMEYIEDGQVIVATYTIENARLAEVSAVFDGATPGAMIGKATRMVEAGDLPPEQIERAERKYRTKLPGAKQSWAGLESKERSNTMANEETQERLEQLDQIEATLTALEGVEGQSAVERLTHLIDENARLIPLAAQGEQYRADLVDEVLAEGVRAMGERFPRETYARMFKTASIEEIKALRESWTKQAGARLPGGRHTRNGDEAPEPKRKQTGPPASAYKV